MIPDFELEVDYPVYELEASMASGGEGTRDHNALIHRDMNDQHTIDAITRLRGELDVRPDTEITPQDIDKIIYGE